MGYNAVGNDYFSLAEIGRASENNGLGIASDTEAYRVM
jgi:hypothetical protein